MPLSSLLNSRIATLSSDQLRALRRDLRAGLDAMDRHRDLDALSYAESFEPSTACPLGALLDGLEASGAVRVLRRLDPEVVDAAAIARPAPRP